MGGVSNYTEFFQLFSSGWLGSFILPLLAIISVYSIVMYLIFR